MTAGKEHFRCAKWRWWHIRVRTTNAAVALHHTFDCRRRIMMSRRNACDDEMCASLLRAPHLVSAATRRQHAVVLTNKYNISFLSGGICSEPPDILNGRHSVLGGTQQQLRYQCEAGYLLWGPSDLVCLANNTYVNAIII